MSEDLDDIAPVLVIGMNRSGTKWLSNELARHPEISAVTDARHYGILESNVFEIAASKFDLASVEDYFGFIQMWVATDFVRHTGIGAEYFYEMDPRPTSFAELFDRLMSAYARRRGTRRWLQKTSPEGFWQTRDYFAQAHRVVIKRNLIDNVRSRVGLAMRHGRDGSLVRAVGLYVLEEKILERAAESGRHYRVNFEGFKANPQATRRDILEFLGLDAADLGPSQSFDKNTSFDKDVSRSEVLDDGDVAFVRGLAAVMRRVPLEVLRRLRTLVASAPLPLVTGTFAQLRDKYGA